MLKQVNFEELIPTLQCYSCKSVPGPEENEKSRYNCLNLNESHLLCNDCKSKCSCGSNVCKKPTQAIEKILTQLPWICQNYKNGCRESSQQIDELKIHQKNCIFREIFCPFPCNQYKVVFGSLNDHFVETHGFALDEIESKNELEVGFDIEENAWDFDGKWTSQIRKAFDLNFFCNFMNRGNYAMFWISVYGSQEMAKNFSYSAELKGENFNYRFNGPILTLDEDDASISGRKLVMHLHCEAVKCAIVDDHIDFNIKIHNEKEEAKDENMESGVSDISD